MSILESRLLSASLLASLCLASVPAFACSICRCGDPTFNALGKEGVSQSGLRLAVDADRLEKSQSDAASNASEQLTEERVTLLATYALTDRAALFARIPYSWRSLDERIGGEREHATSAGLADPEVYGQIRLWSSRLDPQVGQRAALFAVAGVKTHAGDNNFRVHGERGDEHLQPGTGSTDAFGGLAGSYQLDRQSALFSSFQYRSTGRNGSGYRYGNIWLANLAYERKLTESLDSALELNFRHADRDSMDRFGAHDDSTGGTMLFITPRVLVNVFGNWVLRAAAQIPVSQSGLNGTQHEDPVFNLGVTYSLGK